MKRVLCLCLFATTLGGCVQAVGPTGGLATQSQTIDLEAADRLNRFQRLATIQGIAPPVIDQLTAPAGTVAGVNMAVPVTHVVFDESTFFNVSSAVPVRSATPVFDVVAENMKRDVPDAALTVLGHTDATGTDAYNLDLSRRRASAVISALIQRGVNPGQLSSVGIGKWQPIAPNATASGRARNRRVEFLISGSQQANLSVVSAQPSNPQFLSLGGAGGPVSRASSAPVLRPVRSPSSPADEGILGPGGTVPLNGAR